MKGELHIKRLVHLTLALILATGPVFSQTSTGIGPSDPKVVGSLTAASGSGSIVITQQSNLPGALVTIHGTYAGLTINFEVSDDAATWYSTTCARTDAVTTLEVSEAVTDNATRAWSCPILGAANFRVRASAYTSGTATINITQTRAIIAHANSSSGGASAPALAFNVSSNGSALVAGGNVVASTAYTNATTTLSNVPGLAFAVAANKSYFVSCNVVYSVDTNTATPNWAFTGPASPTTVLISGAIQPATTTNAQLPLITNVITSFGTNSTNATTTVISTNFSSTLTLLLQNGANAGTVQLQAKANGVGTLTIAAGSMCQIQQL